MLIIDRQGNNRWVPHRKPGKRVACPERTHMLTFKKITVFDDERTVLRALEAEAISLPLIDRLGWGDSLTALVAEGLARRLGNYAVITPLGHDVLCAAVRFSDGGPWIWWGRACSPPV